VSSYRGGDSLKCIRQHFSFLHSIFSSHKPASGNPIVTHAPVKAVQALRGLDKHMLDELFKPSRLCGPVGSTS
jgi:hypothetical protein